MDAGRDRQPFVDCNSDHRLYVSAERAWSPPIDVAAVRQIAATLPNNPRAIEAAVHTRLVPYAVPWETYGVPWYFPTAAEVLARGQGDCEAQAVVLASILHSKGIPARLVGSLDHLWVDYPGKHATRLENAAAAIATQRADGSYHFRWPGLVNWQASWQIERAYFWDAMPAWRGWLLLGGALLIGLWSRRWPGPHILPWRLGWPRRRHAGAASIALRHPEPDAEGRSVALVVLDKREQ